MRISMFRTVLLGGAYLACSIVATAQTAPRADRKIGALDVAIIYDSAAGQTDQNSVFWMYGGSVQFHDRFYKNWGAVADFSMLKTKNMASSGVPLTLMMETFGPRYTYSLPKLKSGIYAQGLVGHVAGLNGVFPGVNGSVPSAGSFAANVGGGVNVKIAKTLAWRAVEASWLRTALPSQTGSAQNNLRLGSGMIFSF